ncbi:hypothetical protein BH20ACT4_BH20ACT4_11810 [soil metagenome]
MSVSGLSTQPDKRKDPTVKKMLAGPALAGALLFGTASVADAQETPSQEDAAADEDSDKTGLFGLIGLLGLAGLAGLKRNTRDTGYDQRTRTRELWSNHGLKFGLATSGRLPGTIVFSRPPPRVRCSSTPRKWAQRTAALVWRADRW